MEQKNAWHHSTTFGIVNIKYVGLKVGKWIARATESAWKKKRTEANETEKIWLQFGSTDFRHVWVRVCELAYLLWVENRFCSVRNLEPISWWSLKIVFIFAFCILLVLFFFCYLISWTHAIQNVNIKCPALS